MRPEASEQRRQKGNLIRFGTVADVDASNAMCRVQTGELTTDWIPWIVPRVGTTIEWSAPSIGEQGIVLCPDGDTSGAAFLRGLYSNAHPAPSSNLAIHRTRFKDGTQIDYNTDEHALTVTLCSGGTATLTADGGITLNGDVQLNGTMTCSEDVIASGISLKNHTHGMVAAGTDSSGAPQ